MSGCEKYFRISPSKRAVVTGLSPSSMRRWSKTTGNALGASGSFSAAGRIDREEEDDDEEDDDEEDDEDEDEDDDEEDDDKDFDFASCSSSMFIPVPASLPLFCRFPYPIVVISSGYSS